jgi:hypothetical protein
MEGNVEFTTIQEAAGPRGRTDFSAVTGERLPRSLLRIARALPVLRQAGTTPRVSEFSAGDEARQANRLKCPGSSRAFRVQPGSRSVFNLDHIGWVLAYTAEGGPDGERRQGQGTRWRPCP